jgi:hypothetical protein
MGSVDKTLFTLKHGNDLLLVQIYVDDIIFSGSSHSLLLSFEAMMENEFQMSVTEELTFFLGIQVKQTKEGTFVHQAKYLKDLIKKVAMDDAKPVLTSMSTVTTLDPDEDGEAVDQREYRGMVGSLLYLTVTWMDIQFIVCLCARFQASQHTSHRQAVKRTFRYLKQTLNFGIWYSASSSLGLVGFLDTDFTGSGIDRKSTLGTYHFLGSSLVCWSLKKQSSVAQSPQRLSMYLLLPNLVDCAHHERLWSDVRQHQCHLCSQKHSLS